MEVNVRHRLCLAGELRLVEVGDVVVAAVEHVEQRRAQLDVVRDVIAGFQVDERGRIGFDAAAFDQRRLAEVPQARAAEPAARMIDRKPDGRDILDRARNAYF